MSTDAVGKNIKKTAARRAVTGLSSWLSRVGWGTVSPVDG